MQKPEPSGNMDPEDLDDLDHAILDVLTDGREEGEPWGIATPAVVLAALKAGGFEDPPVRQTINNRMKRLELASHLENRYGKGEYVLVDDPRSEEAASDSE